MAGKIEIKEENKGKFTKWCKTKGHDSVTQECIEEGLASKSAKVAKQALFAKNAKKWN
jgi:hypothetical protein